MNKFHQIVKAFQDSLKRNSFIPGWHQPGRYLLYSEAGGSKEDIRVKYKKEIVSYIRRTICCPVTKLNTSFLSEIPPTLIFSRGLSNRYLNPEENTLQAELTKINDDYKRLLMIPTWMRKTKIKRFQERVNINKTRNHNANQNKAEPGNVISERRCKLTSFSHKKPKPVQLISETFKHKNFYKAILSKLCFNNFETKNVVFKKTKTKNTSLNSLSELEQLDSFKLIKKNEPVYAGVGTSVLQKKHDNENSSILNHVTPPEPIDNNEKYQENSKVVDPENNFKKTEDRSQVRRYKHQNATNEIGDQQTLKLKAKKYERNKPEVDFYIKKLAVKYGKTSDEKLVRPKISYKNNRQRITYDIHHENENNENYAVAKKIKNYSKKHFNELKNDKENIKIFNRGSNNQRKSQTMLQELTSLVKKQSRNLQLNDEKVKRGKILGKQNSMLIRKSHTGVQGLNKKNNAAKKLNLNNGLLKKKETNMKAADKLMVKKKIEIDVNTEKITFAKENKKVENFTSKQEKGIYEQINILNKTNNENNYKTNPIKNNATQCLNKISGSSKEVTKFKKSLGDLFENSSLNKVEEINQSQNNDHRNGGQSIINHQSSKKVELNKENNCKCLQIKKVTENQNITDNETQEKSTDRFSDQKKNMDVSKNQNMQRFQQVMISEADSKNMPNKETKFTPISNLSMMSKQRMITRKYKMNRFPPIINTEESPAYNPEKKTKINNEVNLKQRTDTFKPENKPAYVKETVNLPTKVELTNTSIQMLPMPLNIYRVHCRSESLDYRVYKVAYNTPGTLKTKDSITAKKNIKETENLEEKDLVKNKRFPPLINSEADQKAVKYRGEKEKYSVVKKPSKSVENIQRFPPIINLETVNATTRNGEKNKISNPNCNLETVNVVVGENEKTNMFSSNTKLKPSQETPKPSKENSMVKSQEPLKSPEENKRLSLPVNSEDSHDSKRNIKDKNILSVTNLGSTKEKILDAESNKKFPNLINQEKSIMKKTVGTSEGKDRNEDVNKKKGPTINKFTEPVKTSNINYNERTISPIINLKNSTSSEDIDLARKQQPEGHTVIKSQLPMTLYRVCDLTDQQPNLEKVSLENTEGMRELKQRETINVVKVEEIDGMKENKAAPSVLKLEAVDEARTENKTIPTGVNEEEQKVKKQLDTNQNFSSVRDINVNEEKIKYDDKKNMRLFPPITNLEVKKYSNENDYDNRRLMIIIHLKQEQTTDSSGTNNSRNSSSKTVHQESVEDNFSGENSQLIKKKNMGEVTMKFKEENKILSGGSEKLVQGIDDSTEKSKKLVVPNINFELEKPVAISCIDNKIYSSLQKKEELKMINKNTERDNKSSSSQPYRKSTSEDINENIQKLGNCVSNKDNVTPFIQASTKIINPEFAKNHSKFPPIMCPEKEAKTNFFKAPTKESLIIETKINTLLGEKHLENQKTTTGQEFSSTNTQKLPPNNQHGLLLERTNMSDYNINRVGESKDSDDSFLLSLNDTVKKGDKEIPIMDNRLKKTKELLSLQHKNSIPENQIKLNKIKNEPLTSIKMDEYASKFVDIINNKHILGKTANTNMFLMHGLNKTTFLKVLFEIKYVNSEKPAITEKKKEMNIMNDETIKTDKTSLDKIRVLENDLKNMVYKQMEILNLELKKKQLKRSNQNEKMSIFNLFDCSFVLQSFNKVSFNKHSLKNFVFEKSHRTNIIKEHRKISQAITTEPNTADNKKIDTFSENNGHQFEELNKIEKCGRFLVKQNPNDVSFLEVLDFRMPISYIKTSIKESASDDLGPQRYSFINSKHMSFYSRYRGNKEIPKNVEDINVRNPENENIMIDESAGSGGRNCSDNDCKSVRKPIKYLPKINNTLTFKEIYENHYINISDPRQTLSSAKLIPTFQEISLRAPSREPQFEKVKAKEFTNNVMQEIKKKNNHSTIKKPESDSMKSTLHSSVKEYQNLGKIEPEVLHYIHKLQNMNMIVTKKGLTTMTSHPLDAYKKSEGILKLKDINQNIFLNDNQLHSNNQNTNLSSKHSCQKIGKNKCLTKRISFSSDVKILEQSDVDVLDFIKDCKRSNFKYLTTVIKEKKINAKNLLTNNEIIKKSDVDHSQILFKEEMKKNEKPLFPADETIILMKPKNKTTQDEFNMISSALSNSRNNLNVTYEVYIKSEPPFSKITMDDVILKISQKSMIALNKVTREIEKTYNTAVPISNDTNRQILNAPKQEKSANKKNNVVNEFGSIVETEKNSQTVKNNFGDELKSDIHNNIDFPSSELNKNNICEIEVKNSVNEKEKYMKQPKNNVSLETRQELNRPNEAHSITNNKIMSVSKSGELSNSFINRGTKQKTVSSLVNDLQNITLKSKQNKQANEENVAISAEADPSTFQLKNSNDLNGSKPTSNIHNQKNALGDVKENTTFQSNHEQSSPILVDVPPQNSISESDFHPSLNKKSEVAIYSDHENTVTEKNIAVKLDSTEKIMELNSNQLQSTKAETLQNKNVINISNKTSFEDISSSCESNKKECMIKTKADSLNKQKNQHSDKKEKKLTQIEIDSNKNLNPKNEGIVQPALNEKHELSKQKVGMVPKANISLTRNDANNLKKCDLGNISFQKQINKEDTENIMHKRPEEKKRESIKELNRYENVKSNKNTMANVLHKKTEMRNTTTEMGSHNQCHLAEHIPSCSRCIKQLNRESKTDKDNITNPINSAEYIAETDNASNKVNKASTQSFVSEKMTSNSKLLTIKKTLGGDISNSKLNQFLLDHKKELDKITKDKRVKSIKNTLSSNLKPKDEPKIIHRPPHTLMSLLNTENDKKKNDLHKRDSKPGTENGLQLQNNSADRLDSKTSVINNQTKPNNDLILKLNKDAENSFYNKSIFECKDNSDKLVPITNSPKGNTTFPMESVNLNSSLKQFHKYNENGLMKTGGTGFNFNGEKMFITESKNKKEEIDKSSLLLSSHQNNEIEQVNKYRENSVYILKPQPKVEGFISQTLRSSVSSLSPSSKLFSGIVKKQQTNYRHSNNQITRNEQKKITPTTLKHKISKYRVANSDPRINKIDMNKNYTHIKASTARTNPAALNTPFQKKVNMSHQICYKEQKRRSISKQSMLDTPSRLVCGLITPRRIQKTKPVLLKEKRPTKLLACTTLASGVHKPRPKIEKKEKTNEVKESQYQPTFQNMCVINKCNLSQTKLIIPHDLKKCHSDVPELRVSNDEIKNWPMNSKEEQQEDTRYPQSLDFLKNIEKNTSTPEKFTEIKSAQKGIPEGDIKSESVEIGSHSRSLVDTVVNNVKEKLQNLPSSVSQMMSPNYTPKKTWSDFADIVRYNALMKGSESFKKWQQKIDNFQKQISPIMSTNPTTLINQNEIKEKNTKFLVPVNVNDKSNETFPNKTPNKMMVKPKTKGRETHQRRRRISDVLNLKPHGIKRTCPQMSYSEVLNQFYACSKSQT